jgi:hypothetical protein
MAVAARSIVSDATNLREVAATLRAILAAKGDGVDRAFAANLEAIALEIDAAAERSAASDRAPDSRSLRVTVRRLRWLAWSADRPTAALLLRLAKEMEERARWRRLRRARAPLPMPSVALRVAALTLLEAKDGWQWATAPMRRRLAGTMTAVLAVLAKAVWGLPSLPDARIAEAVKTVPASPPARPATQAALAPEPQVAATAPTAADAPQPPPASAVPAPMAELAPRSSDSVAEPKSVAQSEAASAPKPRRASRPRRAARQAPADETRSRMPHALDAAGTGTEVLPPAPRSAANTPPARAPGAEASTPTKGRRAGGPEPATPPRQ